MLKQAGAARNFEVVALEELPVLYRIAKRLTLDPVEAEDLVSQTLSKAWAGWKSFDGSHPRSWLVRIMKNEHFAAHRRKQSRPVTVPLEMDVAEHDSTEQMDWTASGDEIWKAVDSLPDEYRLTISLCDVEELTYEEAAKALEVPVGTIRSRLFRARRMLRVALAHMAPQG